MNAPVRTLSLFTGVGGLDLSIELAIGPIQPVLYVEREAQAAEILVARMQDGSLPHAPIWSDISTLDGTRLRGLVDGIIGGFPCQDLSVAGRRAGIQRGTRSGLFYEYARIIREVEPRWVYIENVPAVLAFPAGGIVLGELAAMGFDAEWGTLRARDVGASHQRKRCFVLAYRRGAGRQQIFGSAFGYEVADEGRGAYCGYLTEGEGRELVANSIGGGWDEVGSEPAWLERGFDVGERISALARADGGRRGEARRFQCGENAVPTGSGADVEHASDTRLEGRGYLAGERGDERSARSAGGNDLGYVFAPGPSAAIWNDVLVRDYGMRPALSQAEAESCLRLLANGTSSPLDGRIDQLRALGNMVVPLQGAAALIELLRRIS